MEEILNKIEGLFFIDDNIIYTIKDKTEGEFPNFYSGKITIQLFTKEGKPYINSISSKLLKVNKNICIYIPYANIALTIVLRNSPDDAALLHGEEIEIESYNIYKGVD